MRTWNDFHIDLQATHPLITAHKDCVSMHHAGFSDDADGWGFVIDFYPCHIDLLKRVITALEEIGEPNQLSDEAYAEARYMDSALPS